MAKFGEALRALHRRVECQTLLLGAAEDEADLKKLRDYLALPTEILAGKLSLLGVACLLRRCRAVLSADSGPRHLANAANVPVFFVANLAVGKIETGAYCDTETDVAPDFDRVAGAKQAAVFDALNPALVSERVIALL